MRAAEVIGKQVRFLEERYKSYFGPEEWAPFERFLVETEPLLAKRNE
jgi:hypothetical protein